MYRFLYLSYVLITMVLCNTHQVLSICAPPLLRTKSSRDIGRPAGDAVVGASAGGREHEMYDTSRALGKGTPPTFCRVVPWDERFPIAGPPGASAALPAPPSWRPARVTES